MSVGFNPQTISERFAREKATELRLLGVIAIGESKSVFETADKIIICIQERLKENILLEDFQLDEIAKDLGLSEIWARISFSLISEFGWLWNQAGSKTEEFGYYQFQIRDSPDTITKYLNYLSINDHLEDYFRKVERWDREDQNTRRPYSITGTQRVANSDFLGIETILANTRGYLTKISSQACKCYEYGLYDASFILIRKLLETLIIELFEKNGIHSVIKDTDGNYLMLSKLIQAIGDEESFELSRNTKSVLPRIKKLADASAHNRRFSAQKSDLDNLRDDIRMMIEEFVHLINYENWA